MESQSICSKILPSDNTKVAVGLTVGLAAAAGAGYLCYRHVVNTPPKKWRRIGELTDLMYYPIKSCAPIRSNELECTLLGLNDKGLRDRVFMVINLEGRFQTARQHSKLVQVHPRYVGGKLIISAHEMPDVTVDFEHIQKNNPFRTVVWGQSVDAVDCGDEVAEWFSSFVLGAETGFRLVYYFKSKPSRVVARENRKFPVTNKDTGALHDETSYMMMNEASMENLNNKLDHNVPAQQFRPNFMVKGPLAFEEDNFKWVRIGDTAIFKYCQPCLRCVFTTIDPEKAERHPGGEPLKTLKSYRKFKETGESPVMGAHLGVRVPGIVKLGDSIYVEE